MKMKYNQLKIILLYNILTNKNYFILKILIL